MTLSVEHFITDTLALVDRTLSTFVQQAFQNLNGYINGIVILLMTLYVINMGYRLLTHQMTLEFMSIVRQLITLIIIMRLTTHWADYHQFIYTVFTQEPEKISQYLAGKNHGALTALNHIWRSGCEGASQLFDLGGLKTPQYYFYGSAVLLATGLNCLCGLSLFIVAKMALAILLAIGPLFLLLMLWSSTRSFVEGWLRGCVNFALIPILATCVLLLANTLVNQTLPGLNSDNPKLWGIFAYIGLSFVSFYMLKQVMSLSAMLSSSVSLESVGQWMTTAGHQIHRAHLQATHVLKGSYQVGKKGYQASHAISNRLRPPSTNNPARGRTHVKK